MNDWDVSEITGFDDLFINLTTFNEPIGNWDVSNGVSFVSYGQGVRFNSIRSLVWFGFQVGCRVKFITDVWLLKKHSLSTNIVFFVIVSC
jgi:hypothetical protein